MKPIDIDTILNTNPDISREDLERSRELTRKLRKQGLQPRGYRIATSHERQRVRTGCSDAVDPRTVHLRRD